MVIDAIDAKRLSALIATIVNSGCTCWIYTLAKSIAHHKFVADTVFSLIEGGYLIKLGKGC